jgi:predicted acetyltransferase
MLYAYRYGFYGRLGYAATTSRKRLAIDSRSVPEAWRALAKQRVRGARGGDRAAIRNVYTRAAARSSGWITRPARAWEHLFSRERLVILVAGAPVRGYVAFTLGREHAYAETLLEVEELVADDGETRRALLGGLAALRDQVSEILLEVPESDPLERALVDPDGRRYGSDAVEHSLGEIVGGPMIRIEDVPRALAARGYPDAASAAFDVVITDAAEQVFAAHVRVKDGRAEIGPARGGAALETTRAGLAALFYGGLDLDDAVTLGLAEIDVRVADRARAALRIAPIGPIDAF